MPFNWDYVDDNTLIYVDTSADGIKAMVDTALGEALEDVKADVVDETISTMDIKLEGENLLYRLLVKGDDKGEINIPKDQFLKSASYDKDNKKLIFVMETTDGEKTAEVSISELLEAIEEKNSEQDASLGTKADKTEVDSALQTINTKNTEQDAAIEEKAVKADVESALALKADKSELEPLAKSADVAAEIAAAVEPLATKEEVNAIDLTPFAKTEDVNAAVEALNAKDAAQDAEIALKAVKADVDAALELKADKTELESLATKEELANVDAKFADYATADALNAEVARATAKENEVTEALNVEVQRATAAESELEGKVTAEQARAEAKEAELVAKDEELDAKKVDWTESTPGRKHIVLKNHDSVLGTATDGGTYNLAMVSKWDVADFGSAQLHANLNSKDGSVTINDDQVIATENVVDTKIETAVSAINSKDEAQDAEIALKAVKADVDAALELKADKTELESLAKSADVTAEIAAAVEPLATKEEMTNAAAEAVAKVVAEAPEDFDTLKEVADYIAADKTKATEIENKLSEHDSAVEALNAKDVELNAAIVDEAQRATAAESELDGKVTAEQARAEAKEAELVAKDEAQDAEIAKKVDRNMDGANGKALIFNESDGGGAKFEHNDGTWSFTGVNDGGENGIAGQIYVIKKNTSNKMEGTRIDMTKGAMYYTVGDASAAERMVAENEIAVKGDVAAVDAKVNVIDLTPFAKTEDMNAVVETLNAKDAELEASISQAAADAVAQVVANAPEDLDTLKEVADYIAADKTKAAEIENKLAELTAKDAELVAKDEAQDAVINGKVDRNMNAANGKALIFNESDGGGAKFEHNDGTWSFAGVNDGGENGIAGQIYAIKKNAEGKMEGTRIDVTKGAMYYTVGDASAAERMVADNEIAVKGDVKAVNDKVDALEIPSIEGLAKSADVTAEIAAAVSVLNTKDEAQDAEIALKADSDKVYTKEDVNNTLEGYVPVEQYNDLKARLDNLEIMMSVYNAEREAQMDEIISNMSSDNKELVIDTLMESIVVPETTVVYTITAPLTDNSTVELTSPKNMTLINTSKEPVSTTISHTYAEGETTTATSVYLVGNFDTLTLENVSPVVKSGYDAASVNNVVISENNVKNLKLNLDFQDGATITNNSDKDITITDKSNSEIALTIVAPNSTVTLSGGQFTTLKAEVSDNTLIIKKNVHIDNLNLSKGNAIVEVARAEEVAGIVENYTVADGYTLSHRVYHITNENSSKLRGTGEMILDEDITRTSSFVIMFSHVYDAVWNLNGHNITVEGTPTNGVYLNQYASNLEVKGNGVIHCEGSYGLWNNSTTGKIIINDGVTIEAQTHAVYAENGVIEINGGTFKLTDWADAEKDANGNLKFLINCYDANYKKGSANIIVKGGKFYDFNPAASYGEPNGPVSYVAEGYKSVMTTEMIDGVEHKVFEVKPINE